MEVAIFLDIHGQVVALLLRHGQGHIHTVCGHDTLPVRSIGRFTLPDVLLTFCHQ